MIPVLLSHPVSTRLPLSPQPSHVVLPAPFDLDQLSKPPPLPFCNKSSFNCLICMWRSCIWVQLQINLKSGYFNKNKWFATTSTSPEAQFNDFNETSALHLMVLRYGRKAVRKVRIYELDLLLITSEIPNSFLGVNRFWHAHRSTWICNT